LTIVFHRRERKGRREKTLFVVKEKDYFTAENPKHAEKPILLFKKSIYGGIWIVDFRLIIDY